MRTYVVVIALFAAGCSTKTVCSLSGPLCEERAKEGEGDAGATDGGENDATNEAGVGDGGGGIDTPRECDSNAECLNPLAPICSTGHKCVGCNAPGIATDSCEKSNAATALCAPNGSCVACLTDTTCPAATPICSLSSNTCVACNSAQAAADSCQKKNALAPFCAPGGTCVACLNDSTCTGATPICSPSTSTCVACNSAEAASDSCGKKNPAMAACASSGAFAGQCVECTTSASCGVPTTPICDQTTLRCRSCALDNECASKLGNLPGVCMSHEDGRCASEAETVYAGGSGCFDVGAGTQQAPACRLEELVPRLTSTTRLIVVRGSTTGAVFDKSFPLTVVGKGGAVIGPPIQGENVQVRVPSNTVTFRDLFFDGTKGTTNGIDGYRAATVQIDRCRFSGFPRVAVGVTGGYKITNTIVDNSGIFGSSVPIYLNNANANLPRLFAYNTVTNNRWFLACGTTALAPDERANLITDGIAPAAEPYYGCSSTFPNSRLGAYAGFDQRAGREYRITAGSPCVNWSQDPSPPMTDIDGDLRPPGQSDCGADEFVP